MIISREQVVRILNSEQELQRRLLESFYGKIARFKNGAKLVAINWLGPEPTFVIESDKHDRSDVHDIREALKRGESDLLCEKRYHC